MQVINLACNDDEKSFIMNRFKKMFSSSNINILLGSAFSLPYLKTLKDVEKNLSVAMELGDKDKECEIKKQFFNESIYPISTIDINDKEFKVKSSFLKTICDILSLRETSTVHKRLNIFTTNYDNLVEMVLEQNNIDYFDGFGGRVEPKFSTANFGKIITRQMELTGRISEIVTVNLYKLHGSIFWKQTDNVILFEDYKERFEKIKNSESDDDFLKNYEKLAIINPEKSKFNSTLLNSNYYDQIRMLANELEKQNSLLLCFGFSFADEHICQIIQRTIKSNPTLTIILFPYNSDDLERFNEIFNFDNNALAYVREKEEGIEDFTLDKLNELVEEVYNGIK